MKLKSMKIVGFKSFAKKTVINFEAGLTAVVGPNGSGKSNIIEAIRWALGEQSAKNLRGTKMPDVIFSGSDQHHPLNRAEVSLTFDNATHFLNSDYSEITITRRIFRDGQGAYFINNSECRLKDINNLLVDSGIGKGSFSIISQGNVEQIFNSKPEQRRTIIETTAGIYKYKLQKQQAETKLATTNENLNRVNDIIYELKDQVERLKGQSENAQKYLDVKKALGRLNDVHMFYQLNELKMQMKVAKEHLERSRTDEQNHRQQIQTLGLEKQNLQQQLQKLLSNGDQLQTKRLDLSNQLEKQISQRQLATQKADFKAEHLKQLREQIDQQTTIITDLKKQVITDRSQYELAVKKLQTLNDRAADNGNDDFNRRITEINQRIHELQKTHFQLSQTLNQLDNQATLKKQSLMQSKAHFSQLQDDLKQRRNDLKLSQKQANTMQQELLELTDNLKINQTELHQHQQNLDQQTTNMNRVQDKWYSQLQRYQQLKSQVDGIQRMLGNHVGFYKGSQNLVNAQLPGVIGVVADFIQVDDHYTQAIETALGNRIQQVITETKSAAQSAIQYLKQHRLGRTTLLPKDNLVQHHIPIDQLNALRHLKGFVNSADQLVNMDDSLTIVKNYLLGNVLVAENLSNAFQISDQVQHRFKVVTLDGEVVNAGGSVTGGTKASNGRGLLAQQNELQKRRQECQDAQRTTSQREQQLRELKTTVQDERQLVANLNRQLMPSQDKVTKLKGQIQRVDEHVNGLKQQIDELKSQIKAAAPHQFLSLDDQKRQQLAKEIQGNQQQIEDSNQQIQELTAAQSNHNEASQKLHFELSNQQQLVTDLKVQLSGEQLQLKEHQTQASNLKQQLTALNGPQKSEVMVDIDEINHQIDTLQMMLGDCNNQIKASRSKVTHFQGQQAPLEKKIAKHQDQLLITQRKIDQLRSTLDQMNVNADRLQMSLDEQPANWDIDPRTIDIEQIQSDIDRLNQTIMNLGPVNINSIDEYQSVNGRYQFLSEQANDLKQSQQQLSQTMNQMDKTVKRKFKKTFDDLQMAFKETFVSIFGGGDAKLVLDDPNHLLTTGLEIMAQPPGKKYRNMSLLSGGERALTAIALLFAILRLHPVPFCILDEAESALDSANVDRFARYISKFKDRTQFIVITHRKETMVYADQLYGITMQDSGISQMIDVNLKQIQKTEE